MFYKEKNYSINFKLLKYIVTNPPYIDLSNFNLTPGTYSVLKFASKVKYLWYVDLKGS